MVDWDVYQHPLLADLTQEQRAIQIGMKGDLSRFYVQSAVSIEAGKVVIIIHQQFIAMSRDNYHPSQSSIVLSISSGRTVNYSPTVRWLLPGYHWCSPPNLRRAQSGRATCDATAIGATILSKAAASCLEVRSPHVPRTVKDDGGWVMVDPAVDNTPGMFDGESTAFSV